MQSALKKVFDVSSLPQAQKIILTPEKGYKTEERWKLETPEHATLIKGLIKSKATVLDFGIGIGRIAKELLLELPDVKITGVDISEKMLNLCRQYVTENTLKRLSLSLFDEINEIADESFDFIYTIYVLQHIEAGALEKTIAELHRMLKPTGELYVFNLRRRSAINEKGKFYDDGIDQLSLLNKFFVEVGDTCFRSSYMQIVLEDHFSKLFTKRT